MSDQAQAVQNVQSQTTDEFFYFFLRLRKDRVRKVVRRLKTQFPEESAGNNWPDGQLHRKRGFRQWGAR